MSAILTLRGWPARRWWVALAASVATVVVVGVPTVLVPNPVFSREIAVTAWAWPVLLLTAVLSGLLTATYVRAPGDPGDTTAKERRGSRWGAVGGLLAYFAVGCPVCNKIALLALGYTGALRWFAPVQPYLAAGGVALLGYALHRRLQGDLACPVRPAA